MLGLKQDGHERTVDESVGLRFVPPVNLGESVVRDSVGPFQQLHEEPEVWVR